MNFDKKHHRSNLHKYSKRRHFVEVICNEIEQDVKRGLDFSRTTTADVRHEVANNLLQTIAGYFILDKKLKQEIEATKRESKF